MSNVLIPVLVPITVAIVGALVTVVYGPSLKAGRDRRRQAEDLEARYRDELMTAAFALQARLYAIAVENLLRSDDPSEVRAQPEAQGYAYTSTLWMIGRYLAWVELLRRDRYFLALGTTNRGRELLAAVAAVEFAFADTRLDPHLRLYRAHQSAIAELMIVERESRGEVRSDSLGYATFTSKLEDENDLVFRRWFGTLMGGLQELASSPGTNRRATELQHALLDLVGFLDEAGAASSYPRAPK